MQIAVGGCLAQKDKNVILEKAPWVDVVFGTHNMGSLPSLLERARHNDEAQLEILDALEVFPSTLPTKRDSTYSGWVSISVGCNNTCTFCIVPALRGKEKDRRPGEILAEIQALVDDGAIEVTLLGQNVNSYGVEFGDRQAFGKLLRAAGQIDGLERIRFTSPHPAAFTDDVIDAMAETPERHAAAAHAAAVRLRSHPQGDAPLVPLREVPRHPRPGACEDPERGDLDRHHRGLPRRDRGGLPRDAARRRGGAVRVGVHVPVLRSVPARPRRPWTTRCRRRSCRSATSDSSPCRSASRGRRTSSSSAAPSRCSSSTGEGKKDAETHRLSGRAEDSRLVHFEVPAGSELPRPGDVVSVTITQAAPFHLLADSVDDAPLRIRRTRAGDAWDRAAGRELRRTGRRRGIRRRPCLARPADASRPRRRAARRARRRHDADLRPDRRAALT